MSEPTAKLTFAYQTISNLEFQVAKLREELRVAESMHVDNVRWIWEEKGFGHCSEMAEHFDKMINNIPEAFRAGYLKAKVDYGCELGYCKTYLDELSVAYLESL